MKNWVVFAFISMFFAGFTSVIAKQGLVGISGGAWTNHSHTLCLFFCHGFFGFFCFNP